MKRKMKAISLPDISLRQCYISYFIHQGTVYPVAGSPSVIFKAAACQPGHWDETAEKLLLQDDLDLVSRWYILNRLSEKKKPLQLYGSAQEATHVLKKMLV